MQEATKARIGYYGRYAVCRNIKLEDAYNRIKNDYKNTKIYTLSTNKFLNQKAFNKNQNTITKRISNFLYKTINSCTNLYSSFCKQETTSNQLSITFSNIYDEFSDLQNEFNNHFKINSKLNTAKDFLSSIKSNFQNLKNFTFNNNYFVSYQIIDIVVNYCSFLSCF